MENIPRGHNVGHPRRDSENDEWYSCQCFMTLHGEKTETTEKCVQNFVKVSKYARRFLCGRWSFLGPGSEKKLCETYSDKPDGNWDKTAEMMILRLNTESGHPNISCIQCL